MTETMEMARQVFQTKNQQTYVVDTPSRGGLETVLTGAICPGDKVLIPAFGRFGPPALRDPRALRRRDHADRARVGHRL